VLDGVLLGPLVSLRENTQVRRATLAAPVHHLTLTQLTSLLEAWDDLCSIPGQTAAVLIFLIVLRVR